MRADEFLITLDNTMAMKTADWVENEIKENDNLVLIDFRGKLAWEKGHLKNSVVVSINDLPSKISELVPDKTSTVISICNGSIQSAMGTMFLRILDYKNSYNLSGGYSSWVRNNKEIYK